MGQNSCSILTTPTSPLPLPGFVGREAFLYEENSLPCLKSYSRCLHSLSYESSEKSTTLLENFRIIKYKVGLQLIMGMKYHATQIVCEESLGKKACLIWKFNSF